MATIKDVASRAGVALGTASRVLSGDSRTSERSRAAVFAAASELGYIANAPARSLRRAKTDVLGLIVSDIRNPFFSELAHAAEQEAGRLGYTVLFANANESEELVDDYVRIFASQRIDGLLLSPQGGITPQLAALKASGVPMVLMNRTLPGLDAPVFGTDNAGGVRSVLSWLHRHGHHEVAFVGGPPHISTGAERLDTYRAGRQAHGISLDDDLIDFGDFLVDGAAAAMHRILARGKRPTAVFGANGPTTLGAMRALREALDASTINSIDIVSFDDSDWFSLASPPITAVRNDAAEIGRLGVRGLIDLIEGKDVESVRVPTELIDRSSSAR